MKTRITTVQSAQAPESTSFINKIAIKSILHPQHDQLTGYYANKLHPMTFVIVQYPCPPTPSDNRKTLISMKKLLLLDFVVAPGPQTKVNELVL